MRLREGGLGQAWGAAGGQTKTGWTHRGRSVVQQTAVLSAVEAEAGVDAAGEGGHIWELQGQEAMAMERHGPSHLQGAVDCEGPSKPAGEGAAGWSGWGAHQQVRGAAGTDARGVQPLEIHILAQSFDALDAATHGASGWEELAQAVGQASIGALALEREGGLGVLRQCGTPACPACAHLGGS